ncbi:MAG: sugar ABC transporter permease [Casimicrobiaceae bacterium]
MTTIVLPASSHVRRKDQRFIESLAGLGFSTPAFILLLITNLAPLAALGFLSLTNYELGAIDFAAVGLKHFAHAFQDPAIRRSLGNTFLYVAIVVPGAVLLSLLVAILIHGRKRTRGLYEVIYFLPVTSTLIAMATMWSFLLHPGLGPVNAAIKAFGFGEVAFLSDPRYVLATLAGIGIWQLLGFNMVLFLAGLAAIPRDLYEAADVDGASHPVDRFLRVTWPLLGPTTMFVTVTTFVTAFKVFDTVAVLTRGGPMGATEVLLYTVYLEGFQYFHLSYAAALTLIFLAFTLTFSVLQTFVLDRRVHY